MIVDRTMYISGQIGLDPNNMEMVDGGVRAEADRVLDFCIINILQIIKMVIYKLQVLFLYKTHVMGLLWYNHLLPCFWTW